MSNVIKIAIIGLGQVGNYLYRELNLQRRNIEIKTAKKIKIIALSAKSKTKKRKYHINKNTFIKFGKYYRDFSQYLNDNLSSGSILISNNARAMPKIGLFSKKIVKERFYLKYGISNAFFEESEIYLIAPQLHEKFIYAEVKNNNWIYGLGFVHEAIWGGETIHDGKQPSKFSDFLKVFIAADGDREIHQPHANALGNHLGIWDFYLIKENNSKKLKIYYQHFSLNL